MTTVIIKGRLTDSGQIEAELPEGWQPGEVSIEIEIDPIRYGRRKNWRNWKN